MTFQNKNNQNLRPGSIFSPRPISYGMKKIVILQTSGNELANQLWNYASIYAYTLERGYHLENPSFFEYGNYFLMPAPNLIFDPFTNYTKRKSAFKRRIWRKIYFWYAHTMLWVFSNRCITHKDADNKPYYLPPTKESEGKLSELEKENKDIYFDIWLFRNPAGLEKYRAKIKEYFKPRGDIEKTVASSIKNLREKYKNLIGVHIRQGDYKTWRNGTYFIEQQRVRKIIEEYLSVFEKKKEQTCFVITSDEPIDMKYFSDLAVVVNNSNAVADLFLLASTDAIIGSNSTFGAFASYYGNIPLIVMQKEPMDWNYYRDKAGYFENKYSSFAHY
jgi:hypothetical protein